MLIENVQIKVERDPLLDIQIESVRSLPSTMFSLLNREIGDVKKEPQFYVLPKSKEEFTGMSEKNNEDVKVGIPCPFD